MTTPPLAVPPRPGEGPPAAIGGGYGTPLAWPHPQVEARQQEFPHPRLATQRARFPQGSLPWFIAMGELPSDPIPMPSSGLGGLICSGQMILNGGSINNVGTTASTVTYYDGMDAKGSQVHVLTVPASTPAQLQLPTPGINLEIGLFVTVSGGLVVGTLYVVHIWKYPFTPPAE